MTQNGHTQQITKTRNKSPQDTLRDMINSERMRNQLALALPNAGMTPDRMIRIVLTAINRTPLLFNCTPQSVLAAVIQSAQLGLEPDGTLGLAYLVPYGNQCQFIVGYRGLIELARRSGLVKNVDPQVVQRGDYFKYALGLNPTLDHIPQDMLELESEELRAQAMRALGGDKVSSILAAYAVVTMRDNEKIFRVVTKTYVDKVRKASRGSNSPSSPWQAWEDQMWMKTAIKHTLKYVPLSPDDKTPNKLAQALSVDERVVSNVTDMGEILSEQPEPVIDTEGAAQQQHVQPNTATTVQVPADVGKKAERRERAAQEAGAAHPTPAAEKQPPLPGFGDDVKDEDDPETPNPAQGAMNAADNFVAHASAQSAGTPPPGGEPPPAEGGTEPRVTRRRRA